MTILNRIRLYHAILASLSLLAYITGEFGIIHAWLGYGVSVVIVFRLLWALSGNRQVGLMRFYPSFEGLKLSNMATHPAITRIFMLGIAISVISVTLTGIALDKGRAIGFSNIEMSSPAYADEDDDRGRNKDKGFLHEVLEEGHEFFANIMLLFVGMHVSYLVLFKFPLAKFMLFIPNKSSSSNKRDKKP